MEKTIQEIGSCQALLRGVKTLVDGSIKVEFEINPQDQEIISKLIQQYALNKRLFQIGIVGVE